MSEPNIGEEILNELERRGKLSCYFDESSRRFLRSTKTPTELQELFGTLHGQQVKWEGTASDIVDSLERFGIDVLAANRKSFRERTIAWFMFVFVGPVIGPQTARLWMGESVSVRFIAGYLAIGLAATVLFHLLWNRRQAVKAEHKARESFRSHRRKAVEVLAP